MDSVLTSLGRERTGKMFADWTERIAKGETPFETPPRPQGAERNVVVTQWDWADPREYFHDVVASDKRDPKVNPNGLVFGLHENSSDHLTWVDPVKNSWGEETIPRSPKAAVRRPRWPRRVHLAVLGQRSHLEPDRPAATATRWIRRVACGTRPTRA